MMAAFDNGWACFPQCARYLQTNLEGVVLRYPVWSEEAPELLHRRYADSEFCHLVPLSPAEQLELTAAGEELGCLLVDCTRVRYETEAERCGITPRRAQTRKECLPLLAWLGY